MLESIIFAVFCVLIYYVVYWSIKNDDGPARRGKKRFSPFKNNQASPQASREEASAASQRVVSPATRRRPSLPEKV